MNKLSEITTKQEEILRLLYSYRFLDRRQIQAYLNHKDKRRIIAWLKELRQSQYVDWIYDPTDFAAKTKPAIYFLGINGIRHLKTLQWDDDTFMYPTTELRKRYRDAERSRTFVERSLLVADCCLALKTANSTSATSRSSAVYEFITEADYLDSDHEYHFLAEHDVLRPNLCIAAKSLKRDEIDPVIQNYILEIFDPTLPQYRLRRRLKNYVAYLDDREWEGPDPEPIILLVCPSIATLVYAKRVTKKLIEDIYEEDLHIRFTTAEILSKGGPLARIWEEGRVLHGL